MTWHERLELNGRKVFAMFGGAYVRVVPGEEGTNVCLAKEFNDHLFCLAEVIEQAEGALAERHWHKCVGDEKDCPACRVLAALLNWRDGK